MTLRKLNFFYREGIHYTITDLSTSNLYALYVHGDGNSGWFVNTCQKNTISYVYFKMITGEYHWKP